MNTNDGTPVELRLLRTFETVVTNGSFVRAADELDYAQSTVTLHIQQLERQLGVELFKRRGKRIELTEAGRALHGQAEPLLRQAAALLHTMREMASGEAGLLRAGAIEPAASYRLPGILVRYCHAHPRVRLSLEVGSTPGICGRVAAGELDFGICSPPSPMLGLDYEPLFDEQMTLLVPVRHPLANVATIDLSSLVEHRILVTGTTCAYRELIEETMLARGFILHDTLEIGSIMALHRAVQSGLGVAIVPRIAVAPPLPGVVMRDVDHLELSLPVGIVRRPDDPPPTRALHAMLTLLRARVT